MIHENGAVAADSFSDHFAVARNHRRVGLDLGHIDQLGTGLFSHDHAVAGSARLVRRGEALQTRNVVSNHLVVRAETAGRDHNSLGVDHVFTFRTLHLDTGSGTLGVLQDLFGLRVHTDVNLAVFSSRVKRANHFRANEVAAGRAMRTGLGGTGHQTDVMEVTAEGEQPVNGILGVVSEHADEFRIVLPVAALHRVEEHDFGGVINPLSLLQRRGSSVQAAGSAGGVAARESHLFDDDHLGAKIVGFNSSSQTSTAGTDDHDIRVDILSRVGDTKGGSQSQS